LDACDLHVLIPSSWILSINLARSLPIKKASSKHT
jgi:hypothetical protein